MTTPLTHRVAVLMAKRSKSGEFRPRTETDVATALGVTPSQAGHALAALVNMDILTFEMFQGFAIYTATEPKPRNMGGRQKKGTDAEFRAMWDSGACYNDVRAHFGYSSTSSVHKRAKKMKLTPRVRITLTEIASSIPRSELALMWGRLDVTIEDMALHFGVNDLGIRTRAAEMGLPSRAENRKARQRLCTDEQFRELWESGMPTDDMATAMGYTNVHSVTARRRRMGLRSRYAPRTQATEQRAQA